MHWLTLHTMSAITMPTLSIAALATVLASTTVVTHPMASRLAHNTLLPPGVTVRGPVWNVSDGVTFGTFHVSAPAYQKDMGDWGKSDKQAQWPRSRPVTVATYVHVCSQQHS
jgi:hypothetical protein